jgi:hypothetical protein
LNLTGGVNENGPYHTTGKHNNVLRVMGPAIAKKLGNALIAPIVTMEPGSPIPQAGRVLSAGSTLISPETFTAILTDMANSLKSQGFQDDRHARRQRRQCAWHGGGGQVTFNDRWKGEGGVMAHNDSCYYSYTEDAAPGFSVGLRRNAGHSRKVGLENGGDGFHDDF